MRRGGRGEHKERGPLVQEAESRQMQGAGTVDYAGCRRHREEICCPGSNGSEDT